MKVEDLLQELREIVEDAKPLPLSGGKCLIDVENIKSLLEDISDMLPIEVKQAKSVVADRNKILEDSKLEAKAIIAEAEEKRKTLITQNEIVRQARAEANDIVADAKAKSRDMRRAVNEYVDEMLKKTDEMLSAQVNEIKKTRQNIKASQPPVNSPVVQKPAPKQD